MNWWRLRRRVHVSWLIATLCLGIVVGVISVQHIPADWFYSAGWLCAGVALAALGVWRRRAYVLIFMLVAGGIIGLWRGSIDSRALAPFRNLVGYTATVQGVVTEDADLGKSGELVLRMDQLSIDGHQMSGSVWVSTNSKKADVKRSDIVTVKGKMSEGFGSFAASMYRSDITRIQRPKPGDIALQVRDAFADQVRTAVPEPEASLGIGYLVGQRRALPPELDQALQVAGLMHVVVASGYNLTILVRLARRLFVKISKYLAALSAGSMIVAFMAITGMSPSMSRAGLVAGLSLLAWYYGRKFHPLVLLPFAAAVTVMINPSYGWNDLGWQLSFAAFGGVMIVAPLLQRYFFGEKEPGTIRQILGETITAQLCTLPILVLAFGQFSNVAIIANVLILPLVPLAMAMTFVTGIGVMILPALTGVVGLPVTWLLGYMTSVAQYVAHLPWAQTELAIDWRAAVAFYVALIAICLYMWRKTGLQLRETNIVE